MKNNPRVTPKEKGLIKSALRRVFSRSELRRAVIDASVVMFSDPTRKRVKKWCRCNICQQLHPYSNMVCDHIAPVVGIDEAAIELSADILVDRLWCEQNNLQAIDEVCHAQKTKEENKARREFKKKKKAGK